MKNEPHSESDPRHHTRNIKRMLTEVTTCARMPRK